MCHLLSSTYNCKIFNSGPASNAKLQGLATWEHLLEKLLIFLIDCCEIKEKKKTTHKKKMTKEKRNRKQIIFGAFSFRIRICGSLELVCHRSVLRETVLPVDTFLLLFVSFKNAIRVHNVLTIREKSAANDVTKRTYSDIG